jgi:hypothetical protein
VSVAPQRIALAELVTRILHAPGTLYADRLQQAGLREGGGITRTSLARIALIRRDDLVRDQRDHPPHGTRRFTDAGHPVRAGASGSGEALLVLTWTAADLARERAAGARVLGRLGVCAGMRVANTLPGALTTPGALLLGDVVEEIGGLDVPLGETESDTAARQTWELVDRVQPEVLVLEETTAAGFVAAAPSIAREWWRGVVWLRRGAASGSLRPLLPGFNGWQRTWLAIAEATSFVAGSCAIGNAHVDDEVLAEIVGASGGPLYAGQDGELVLTTLGLDTPVVRFATGVRARMPAAPCACGESGIALELL